MTEFKYKRHHLRTSNPIESVFATVRHRTVRTKDSLSSKTARLMVFKLVMAAARTWRRRAMITGKQLAMFARLRDAFIG